MAPPLCRSCGVVHCTELERPNLRKVWKQEAEYKWFWHSDRQAYWALCLHCHRLAWPTDHRAANRFSQPRWMYWSRCRAVGGVCRLVSGDFYLTAPVPECFRPRHRALEPARHRALEPARHRALEQGARTGLQTPRGCMKGSRGFRLEQVPSFGRRMRDRNSSTGGVWYLGGGIMRPMRRRERAREEEIHQIPWVPVSQWWPAALPGLLPAICDAHRCCRELRLHLPINYVGAMTLVMLAADVALGRQSAFACRPCLQRLKRDAAPDLRGIFGDSVHIVWGHQCEPRKRLEQLGAPYFARRGVKRKR